MSSRHSTEVHMAADDNLTDTEAGKPETRTAVSAAAGHSYQPYRWDIREVD